MKRFLMNFGKRIGLIFLYGVPGALAVLVFIFVWNLEKRPDLKVWHSAELEAEFTVHSQVKSFREYLALEKQLFAQLDEFVYKRIQPEERVNINRYSKGSIADPENWSPNWNRTFELTNDNPQCGVLLLHGLSDSPYSMRSLGKSLHDSGAWVVGLRIPGHGTAPTALVNINWQDMAAAVKLAMHHLRDKVGEQPLYIVGYSNGAALAVNYTLDTLDDKTLPLVSRLVLLSPEIGVTRVAALSVWQARLGHLLNLKKLEWNDILPEYDPFKYNSFAINAGDLSYRLTVENRLRLTDPDSREKLKQFPPVIAFQSVVDQTVSMKAVVENLFRSLPPGENELMLFDINRSKDLEMLLKDDPKPFIDSLFKDNSLSFSLNFLTNAESAHGSIVILRKAAGHVKISETITNLQWPENVYSLSHVALPFPADDPLYGGNVSPDSPGIQLGSLSFRGERDILQIRASTMLRLRWNPFYDYMENKMLNFLGLDDTSASKLQDSEFQGTSSPGTGQSPSEKSPYEK